MCDYKAKQKNKAKIDKLIDAIEHLDRTIVMFSPPTIKTDPSNPSIESVAKQIARMSDDLAKIVGIMSVL